MKYIGLSPRFNGVVVLVPGVRFKVHWTLQAHTQA